MCPSHAWSSGDEPDFNPSSPLVAIHLLGRAQHLAAESHLDPWDFAVSFTELLAAGLTETDLRWLIARGLVRHALERFRRRARRRSFESVENLGITPQTCFVLTAAGERFRTELAGRGETCDGRYQLGPPAPRWDPGRRHLSYGGQIVKAFRVPADNQETILSAFEEDGWPPRIDDPLPRPNGCDHRERLHQAVKGLNRGHLVRALVFRRDGKGEGVLWQPNDVK